MDRVDRTRRGLLTQVALGGGGLLLSGCKLLDGLIMPDNRARRIMEAATDLSYRSQRLLMGPDALAPEFTQADVRQPMRPNGVTAPREEGYRRLAAGGFADYRLEVHGLVERPLALDLATIRGMPARTQITRHDCVEGWSCIAEWTGVPLATVLAAARPRPEARYVVFWCYGEIENALSGPFTYYETIDMVDAYHAQTILAYGMNGADLPEANGAPLRLRVERQLGYKMAKFLRSIELVASFETVGDGRGGFWEDWGYSWYAGI